MNWGFTFPKTAFFIVAAVKTSNLTTVNKTITLDVHKKGRFGNCIDFCCHLCGGRGGGLYASATFTCFEYNSILDLMLC
jgi:hypothetical protein